MTGPRAGSKIPPDVTEVKATRGDKNGQEKSPALFLTVREVARMLELSEARIYALIAEGKFPATRRGRAVRIPRAAFDRWLELEAELALANVRTEEPSV